MSFELEVKKNLSDFSDWGGKGTLPLRDAV